MKITDNSVCVACGLYGSFLCAKHRKRYIYYKKYDFVAFKPRRKMSKAQTALFKKVRDVFKSPVFQEVIFPFMLFYRMDIVVPDYKVIIEYDSELHFKFNKHFHKTRENFKRRQALDGIKDATVEKEGWKVVRINYKDTDVMIDKKLKYIANKRKKFVKE